MKSEHRNERIDIKEDYDTNAISISLLRKCSDLNQHDEPVDVKEIYNTV